jgi:hypothetical protein
MGGFSFIYAFEQQYRSKLASWQYPDKLLAKKTLDFSLKIWHTIGQ